MTERIEQILKYTSPNFNHLFKINVASNNNNFYLPTHDPAARFNHGCGCGRQRFDSMLWKFGFGPTFNTYWYGFHFSPCSSETDDNDASNISSRQAAAAAAFPAIQWHLEFSWIILCGYNWSTNSRTVRYIYEHLAQRPFTMLNKIFLFIRWATSFHYCI